MSTNSRWQRAVSDILLCALGLGPLAGFLLTGGLQCENTAAILRSLGRLAGIAGLAWFLLAMFLSIRAPGLDRPMGGLIRVWRVHHWLGAASFLLLLLHPVLLSLSAAAHSPAAVLAILTPPIAHWPLWTGWLSLLFMMVFLAPTFSYFGEPDYQRWKAIHLLSAAAGVFGVIHATALTRSLSVEHAIWLWGGFGILAATAFAWRKIFSRVLARKPYRITAVVPLAERVVEISFEAEGKPLNYTPGQFVYLTPLDANLRAGKGEEHPYTVSSAPEEKGLRIAIKTLGDASGAMLDAGVGTVALVEGPYGQFLPATSGEATLWIGGGIGITPFVSAARSLALTGSHTNTHLVYCANDVSRAYFLSELAAISERVPGFSVHAHLFADEGALTAGYLAQCVPDFTERRAFICGPLPLIALARRLLLEAGVARSRISSEEFTLL